MIALFFKTLFLFILFIFLRGLFRILYLFWQVKRGIARQHPDPRKYNPRSEESGIFEAEYRVVNDKK